MRYSLQDFLAGRYVGVRLGIFALLATGVFFPEVNPWYDPSAWCCKPEFNRLAEVLIVASLPVMVAWLRQEWRIYAGRLQARYMKAWLDRVTQLQDAGRWQEATQLLDEIDRITVKTECRCGAKMLYPRASRGMKIDCT